MTTDVSYLERKAATTAIKPGDVIVAVLACLTLLGVVAGVGRLVLGLGPTTGLNDEYPWGIWIGFDFLLIAFAGTGFTMAALVHVFRLEQFKDAVRPAVLAGLLGYTAVLLLLVLDLGRPDRFYHFIISWNLHSPLFEVSWCVLLYTTVLVIENSPFLFERLNWRWPVQIAFKIMPVVAIVGVTLSSLHQSTLGTLYLNMPHRINPLWYTPILPVLFFTSAVMAGLSLAVLVYILATRIVGRPAKVEIVDGLGKGAALVALIYLVMKVGDLALAGKLPALFALDEMSLLMLAELGIGVVLPAALLLVPTVGRRPVVRWLAPALILAGVFANRFDITLFAQRAPDGAIYVPSWLEWLSTAGILSAVALAWYLAVRFLVIFDSRAEEQYHH